MIVAHSAISHWMTRCMAATDNADPTPREILVLHDVSRRARAKRLADISFLLDVEDAHTVNDALRKMMRPGLLTSEILGKGDFYGIFEAGEALCRADRECRR